jgi:hypothetical protein
MKTTLFQKLFMSWNFNDVFMWVCIHLLEAIAVLVIFAIAVALVWAIVIGIKQIIFYINYHGQPVQTELTQVNNRTIASKNGVKYLIRFVLKKEIAECEVNKKFFDSLRIDEYITVEFAVLRNGKIHINEIRVSKL